MGRREILTVDEIKSRIVPVLKERGVRRAVLFGSYAKGKARISSDIDIMVETELKGLDFSVLTYTLEEALDKRRVDLINKSWIKESSILEKEIDFYGVELYRE